MNWTNEMTVTLKDNATAIKALDILCDRLSAGFEYDTNYRRNPSMQMHDHLDVIDNIIVLPEGFGSYLPEDAAMVILELMRDLAEHLSTETFAFDTCNNSDYDEGWVDGNYANGVLTVKTTYFPSGYSDLYCEECGELIATMDEYEEGKIYICPECEEEIDLSAWLPIVAENTIEII